MIINKFVGPFSFLSNFYPLPDGKTTEHYYQSAKANDPIWQQRIMDAATPGQAKRLGRKAPLRPDWEEIKIDVMRDLVRAKFQYELLRSMLLTTGDSTLIEGNTWGDTFWGVCNGVGENWLGRILMEVRDNA